MKVVVKVGEGSATYETELRVGELYEFGDPHYYFTVVGVRDE